MQDLQEQLIDQNTVSEVYQIVPQLLYAWIWAVTEQSLYSELPQPVSYYLKWNETLP